jgi:hypothetical protein
MGDVTHKDAFRRWSADVSELLLHAPKREILTVEG